MKNIVLLLCCLITTSTQESDNCFVSLEPRQFIGVPGTNFVYTCSTTFGPRASSAEWFLNGQMFNESIPDINFYSSSARVYYLEIANASLNFNNTNIMCSLTVNERVCNSNVSILQLQGHPGQVENVDAQLSFDCIANGSLALNWTESATLDISLSQTDVQYRVSIADEFGNRVTEYSEDSVLITILPDSNTQVASCSYVEIVITPFNNYANGNSTIVYTTPNEGKPVTIVTIKGELNDYESIKYTLHAFPAICDAKITLRDIFNDEDIVLPNSNVKVNSYCYNTSKIEIELNNSVSRHRRYNATFYLPQNEVNSSVIISTHDILTGYLEANVLRVIFLENTTAIGALIMFRSNETSPFLVTLHVEMAQFFEIPNEMSGRSLYLYDIQENGHLLDGIAYPIEDPMQVPGTIIHEDDASQNNKCSLNLTNIWTLNIYCNCDSTVISDGLQTIVFLSDDYVGTIYSRNGKCLEQVLITVNRSGEYNIAVFAVNDIISNAKNSIFYSGNITVQGHEITSEPEPSTDTTSTYGLAVILYGVIGVPSTVVILCVVLPLVIVITLKIWKRNNFSKRRSFSVRITKEVAKVQIDDECLQDSEKSLENSVKYSKDDKKLTVDYQKM